MTDVVPPLLSPSEREEEAAVVVTGDRRTKLASAAGHCWLLSIPCEVLGNSILFPYLRWADIYNIDQAFTNYALRPRLMEVYRCLRVLGGNEGNPGQVKGNTFFPNHGWPLCGQMKEAEARWKITSHWKYRFMPISILLWALRRGIKISCQLELALDDTSTLRTISNEHIEEAISYDQSGHIQITSLQSTRPYSDFLLRFEFSSLLELNVPLTSHETWDAAVQFPCLCTLHVNEKCENVDYGLSVFLISTKRKLLKSLYIYSRSASSTGYSARFWRNVCNFNLETLGIGYLTYTDNLRREPLDDFLLPNLPASLRRLEFSGVPSITYGGVIKNLHLPSLQFFRFHEVCEVTHIFTTCICKTSINLCSATSNMCILLPVRSHSIRTT